MTVYVKKTMTIAGGTGEVIIGYDDVEPRYRQLTPQNDTNLLMISSQITPTAGTFLAYVEYVENGGFFGVPKLGAATNSIDATKIGPSVADGEAEGFSFSGNPYQVKVVAAGIAGTAEVDVVLIQNK